MGIKHILKSTLKFLVIFMVLLQAVVFTACAQKTYHETADIERSGDIYYIYNNEIQNSQNKSLLASILPEEDQYWKLYYTNIELPEIKVDADMYNFIVAIPVKSKQNFIKLFSNRSGPDFYLYIESKNKKVPLKINDEFVEIASDGYYHYTLYVHSLELAANYLFNDIKDLSVYLDYTYTTYDVDIDYSTNKLTVLAEEFEEMLDGLGISHERLEFQPDGY